MNEMTKKEGGALSCQDMDGQSILQKFQDEVSSDFAAAGEAAPIQAFQQYGEDQFRIGASYILGGHVIRILGHDKTVLLYADQNMKKISRMQFVTFKKGCIEETIIYLPPEGGVKAPDLPKKERERAERIRQAMEKTLAEEFPNWDRFFVRNGDDSYLDHAEEARLSTKQFRILLKAYLLSGRDPMSLVSKQYLNAKRNRAPESSTIYNDCGRHYTVREVELQLQAAKAKYLKSRSGTKTYGWLLGTYYPTRKEMMEACKGKPKEEAVIAQKGTISYWTMMRYINTHLGGASAFSYSHGASLKRKKTGAGNAQYVADYPGQYLLVDATEFDAYTVLEDGTNTPIKAVMYLGVDVLTICITAWYVGVENNSVEGFRNLFKSLLEPHEEQVKRYGLHCSEDEFPSMYMCNFYGSDHGSDFESDEAVAMAREANIHHRLDGLGRPEQKGLVEEAHRRIQQYAKDAITQENGYIRHDDERGMSHAVKAAKEGACLYLSELRAIICRVIIELNKQYLPQCQPDADQMEAGVPMTPMARWKYYSAKCGTTATQITEGNLVRYIYAFSRRNRKFTITDKGIVYTVQNSHLYFYSEEEWFKDLLSDRHRPRCAGNVTTEGTVDFVYIKYQGEIHRVGLAEKRPQQKSFAGMTWDHFDELAKKYNDGTIYGEKVSGRASKSRTLDEISERVAYAQSRHSGEANPVKDLKPARRKKQLELMSGPDEVSARLSGQAFGRTDEDIIDGEAEVIAEDRRSTEGKPEKAEASAQARTAQLTGKELAAIFDNDADLY